MLASGGPVAFSRPKNLTTQINAGNLGMGRMKAGGVL